MTPPHGEGCTDMVSSGRGSVLPLLPVKRPVVLPSLNMPVAVRRPASVVAVEEALASEEKMVAVFTQRDPATARLHAEDLYPVGTSASIRLIARSTEVIQLVVQGFERVEISEVVAESPFLKVRVRPLPLAAEVGIEAIQREIMELAGSYFALAHPEMDVDFPRSVPHGV